MRSGSGDAKRICSTRVSPVSSLSNVGLRLSFGPLSRTASASARGTGALKASVIGRIGRQAAWAFSRSQLKLAVKGSRTVKRNRDSTEVATPPGVLMPLPYTTCTLAAAGRRRLQVKVT